VHYLTACLIFKDSAPYLDEWIRFHLRVGFDHLYLYDNDSSDDCEQIIRPFVARRQVTLHKWPGLGQQRNVFQHCLDTYRESARWMAILDDDEFLFPAEKDNLKEILPEYEAHAGVAICWQLFGSNGHRTQPPGLVTENYRRRAPWIDWHVKCVLDPSKVIAPEISGHAFRCIEGARIVDENRRATVGAFSESPSANVLCLNHYLIKSQEELARRRTRLLVEGIPPIRPLEEWQALDRDYNAVEDLRIQRFTRALKRQQLFARLNPLSFFRQSGDRSDVT
jgi:glycosyltransferase involved in cell wall biosynthesis